MSTGDTIEIGDEIVYVNGAETDSLRYAYFTVATIFATTPVGPATDQGFFYKYREGKTVADSLYADVAGSVVKIANVIGIDYETNTLKVEMITQPGSTNRYPIPTVGTSIANAPENDPRYSQNISAVSNVKVVPVIRGFDGTTATTHNSDLQVTSQIPTGKISEYVTRLYVTSATMDIFSVGTYIKGSNSDATARIVRIETLTSTTGYLWVNEIAEGPDASDLPKFGNFDISSGTWGPETIQEIGSGNETTVAEDVAVADTTISAVSYTHLRAHET